MPLHTRAVLHVRVPLRETGQRTTIHRGMTCLNDVEVKTGGDLLIKK
jgi:hypothetical protein